MATKRPTRVASSPQARYDAASHTRRTASWHTRSSGPNAEIGSALSTLRNRHRDLARNNPWIRRAINGVVNNTVGEGIRAQWADPDTQALWDSWHNSTAIDADGRLNGAGLQALILRTIVESGEVLIRLRPRPSDSRIPLKLQLQILEPDFIDHTKTELTEHGHITQGIEFDASGRRIAYWLHSEHPGDPLGRAGGISSRHPADDILHIYRLDRPGQVRGVPWGTGAMLRAKMLDDYQDAQLERQRLAACFSVFITDPEGLYGQPGADAPGILDRLEPGAIEILPPGMRVEMATPPQPSDDKAFTQGTLRAIAADYGLPYEILTGDLSEVNFSSARMGWNEFARSIDLWRWHMLAPQYLDPLVQRFVEVAALQGHPIAQATPLWTAPARTMVDEVRELPALAKAVSAGLISHPEAIRKRGYDPDILLAEQAEWQRKVSAAGVQFATQTAPDPETPPANSEESAP